MTLGKCRGTNRDGSPCQAKPYRGDYCQWHDPALAAERAAWRARGGERTSSAARASKALPKDLAGVRDAMLRALGKLEGGDLDPRTATAMAAVARALVALHEAGAMERQLAALEASPEWRDVRARILAALAEFP